MAIIPSEKKTVQGSPVHWDDIAGLQFVKTTVKEIVVFPLLRPDIFHGLRAPPKVSSVVNISTGCTKANLETSILGVQKSKYNLAFFESL